MIISRIKQEYILFGNKLEERIKRIFRHSKIANDKKYFLMNNFTLY